jgi:hypothetical protein
MQHKLPYLNILYSPQGMEFADYVEIQLIFQTVILGKGGKTGLVLGEFKFQFRSRTLA